MDSFTQYAQDSIWHYDANLEDSLYSLKYINDPSNFRSFSDGLSQLIEKYGYKGDIKSVSQRTDFLLSALSKSKIDVSKATVTSWFDGTRRPLLVANSRTLMFQVCLSLSVSLSDTVWFFEHVYYDRCFNYHSYQELVYYYCITHSLPYEKAVSLIESVKVILNTSPSESSYQEDAELYTYEIKSFAESFSNDSDILTFFKENRCMFGAWNKSAQKKVDYLLEMIKGDSYDKEIIMRIKEGKAVTSEDISKCHLIIRELFDVYGNTWIKPRSNATSFDYEPRYFGKNIASIDFMLDCIFDTGARINKKTDLPDIVKTNFPSKSFFSVMLDKQKVTSYTSYDSIRKTLILLKFYEFWCRVQLDSEGIQSMLDGNDLFEVYCSETNRLLVESGYNELYAGNPYDWIFLRSSCISDKPLDFFRDLLNEILVLE